MAHIDLSNLTPAQTDGIACVACEGEYGAMVPVGTVDARQVFAHPACVDKPTAPTTSLVIAPTSTPADVKALRAVAFQVAYETGRPATWATDADHVVTDYRAVYLSGDVTSLRNAPTLVLVGEAIMAGVDVFEPLGTPMECPCGLVLHYARPYVDEAGEIFCAECTAQDACAWCGDPFDMENAEFVERGNTWVPLHAGCLEGLRASTSRSALPAAV